MEEKITIIEGPPPTFEVVEDGWVMGLIEAPYLYDICLSSVRTFNGPALVERCYRAWKKKETINLHYRNDMGLEQQVPILAARSVDTEEGQVLLLWTRHIPEDIEVDIEIDVDGDDLSE